MGQIGCAYLADRRLPNRPESNISPIPLRVAVSRTTAALACRLRYQTEVVQAFWADSFR